MKDETVKHTPGCKPGWRVSGCEECERLIATAQELLAFAKRCLTYQDALVVVDAEEVISKFEGRE